MVLAVVSALAAASAALPSRLPAARAARFCSSEQSCIAISRRAVLALLPVSLLTDPGAASAAVTGGGFEKEQFVTQGSGPPPIKELPQLTKGEPSEKELQRLVLGYKRLQYLLRNWEVETTVCIKGCKGKYDSCGCTRDPIIVQQYMGYKSMNDPLFKAGDLMLRASSLIESDDILEKYTAAMEKWNNKAEQGNVMAYVSSWGEANPGGGQDAIARYLEKSRKEVIESAELLKTILDCLGLKVDS